MSNPEQEPQKPKYYYAEYNGERCSLLPNNTLLYLHSQEPQYDHAYVQFPDDENGEQVSVYLWRKGMPEIFDDMVLNLVAIGVNQFLKPTASEFDKEQYIARFGEAPEIAPNFVAPELQPEIKLTARQERLAEFVAYLLLHERLTAEDFNGSGELYI